MLTWILSMEKRLEIKGARKTMKKKSIGKII